MPISLPNLDDLDWQQLIDEGRMLIPASAPEWTNHNPSDPGITMLELFAYLTEILNYRLNRVGDENVLEYLSLLRGPNWKPGTDLHKDVEATVARLREVRRAVTPRDYEKLALAVGKNNGDRDGERVGRVKCLPLRNLDAGPAKVDEEARGHVSLLVLPNRRGQPTDGLLRAVRHALEPARTLTTRIHVARPSFVTFGVRLTLIPQANVIPAKLQEDAVKTLELYFDPLRGSAKGDGWPFGRSVYVSELYQVLGNLAGVDYVVKSRNQSTEEELDELMVGEADRERLLRQAGELEALTLKPNELVALWIDLADISVGRRMGEDG